MKKITLSIGTLDKDTKKQVISNYDAEAIISEIIFTYCDGGTITRGTGIYTHDDGTKIMENTIIVYLYDANIDAVKDAVNVIKKALNQETVAMEISDINSMFL